jgi:uncharacterized protein YjbJ (UPF0337 family)
MNMPENFDDAKGQVKEKVGDVTDDQSLENEGKVDQATGKVKSAFDDAADSAKDAADSVKDKVEDLLHRDDRT